MTTYLLPCGVSVLDGLRRGKGAPADADPDALVAEAQTWATHARAGADDQALDTWRVDLADPWRDAELDSWDPKVCAELSTLSRRLPGMRSILHDRHTVVVLASDTTLGLASAGIVASWLAGAPTGWDERVRYHSAPSDLACEAWQHRFVPGTVSIVRVVDLNPLKPNGIRSATAGIGRVLRAVHESAGGSPVEAHLTGGLKATLLHLMTMVEVLRSMPGADVSAWYLHDDEGPDRTETVEIGLRRFDSAYLADLRTELCAIRDGRATNHRTFEGVGWETSAGSRQLTAFGTGFLAVLGERIVPSVAFDGTRA